MKIDDYFAKVGQDLGVSEWLTIDQDRIDAFAEATLDQQFIHVDPARAAAETPFDSTIAHGFLTLSLLVHFSVEAIPDPDGLVSKLNYGMNKLRFVAPVPVNSRIRGRFKLADIQQNAPGVYTLIWSASVEIENQSKPALVAEWIARLNF